MGNSPKIIQFKINPVELVIFSVVSLMLLNSVYNLFYEPQGFQASGLLTLNSSRETDSSKSSGTQATPMFLNYDFRCDANAEQSTSAGKVRLGGGFCGQPAGNALTLGADDRGPASDGPKLMKIDVANTANKFSAIVFTDSDAAKFTTDYIPLNQGKNPIQVDFFYTGGKSVTQTFNIERN